MKWKKISIENNVSFWIKRNNDFVAQENFVFILDSRNNYIYTWQVNRNPFIDYPNLADYIWGENYGQQWFPTLSQPKFDEANFRVYPIPTRDEITISGVESFAKVEIYAINGQQVLSKEIEGFTQLKLNLPSGMYLMKIQTENQTITKKIIIK